MATTWQSHGYHMGVTVTIVVSLPLSVTVAMWEPMVHRPPLRYIRLGVFTSTPQLQSLRLSSDYIYLTDFLLPLYPLLSLISYSLSFCSCLLSLTSSLLLLYVRVLPLISYFSHMHYYIIVLHSCVVLTVFDLLERCVSLVLRLAI